MFASDLRGSRSLVSGIFDRRRLNPGAWLLAVTGLLYLSPSIECSAAPRPDSSTSINLTDFNERYPRPRGFGLREPGVFYLDLHDFGANGLLRQGSLFRELPRQAMLIAARDGLGYVTRDRALREGPPFVKNPSEFPLSVLTSVDTRWLATISVIRHSSQGVELLWEQQYQLNTVRPREAMAAIAERLSREDFVEILKQQGYAEQSRPAASGAASELPHAVIDGMTEYGQLAALRDLHARLRGGNDSPEVLGALARAYANLSNLSLYYCGPQFKVFQARAWLYAERAVAASKGSAEALDHRGYARALTGYLDSATADFEAAAPSRTAEPHWQSLVEAFCVGDIGLLEEALESDTDADSALPTYLLFLLQGQRTDLDLQTSVTTSLIDRAPDCFRGRFALGYIGTLGMHRTVHSTARTLPGITARGLQLIVDEKDEQLGKSLKPDGLQDARDYALLVDALRKSGRPQVDAAEPSLDAVAGLLEEIAFLAAWRVIYVDVRSLSIDAQSDLQQLETLCPKHPYIDALQILATKGEDKATAATFVEKVNLDEIDVGTLQMFRYLPAPGTEKCLLSGEHSIDRSLFEILANHDIGSPYAPEHEVQNLERVAKWHPATVEWGILGDDADVAVRLPEIEKRWIDDRPMQGALAAAYLRLKDSAGARRCAMRQIAMSPSSQAYRYLADAEELDHNTEGWLAALLKSLSLPVTGLEHARTRAKISEHYRQRAQPQEALPYAQSAAESYAAWAMTELIEVYTRLEDWGEAESLLKNLIERYPDVRARWAIWCLRTGHGDLKSALAAAAPELDGISRKSSDYVAVNAILIDLCSRNADRAYKRTDELARRRQLPHLYWLAFMLADSRGYEDVRLEMVQAAAAAARGRQPGRMKGTEVIADNIIERLEAGRHDLDTSLIDAQMARLPEGGPTWMWCVLGSYLKNHKQLESGTEYLRRAAESPIVDQPAQWLAAYLLREAGVDIGPMRRVEFVPPSKPADSVGGSVVVAAEPLIHVSFLNTSDSVLYTNYDGRIVHWNTMTGHREPWCEYQGMLADIARQGDEALILSNRNDAVALWTRGRGEPTTLFAADDSHVWAARFRPDDPQEIIRLDSATDNPASGLYSVSCWPRGARSPRWRTELTGITAYNFGIDQANNRCVVAGQNANGDGWLGLYGTSDGQQSGNIVVPDSPLIRLAVSSHGNVAATISPSRAVTLWNLSNLKPLHRYVLADAQQAALSNDGSLLAIAAGDRMQLYDVVKRKQVCLVSDFLRPVTWVRFSLDGRHLAAVSRDHTARVWPVDLLQKSRPALDSSRPLQLASQLLSSKLTYAFGVGAADLDNDGDLDLTYTDALRNNDLNWFENDGSGNSEGLTFHQLVEDMPTLLGRHVFSDVNRDGLVDVIIGEGDGGDVVWLENEGSPRLVSPWKRHFISEGGFKHAYDYAIADFDGDGDPDVAAAAYKTGVISWFENDVASQIDQPWTMHSIATDLDEVRCIRSADFDGDGDGDLVISARVRGEVLWYENSGDPAKNGWIAHVIDDRAIRPTHGEPCDMDRDGDLDLVMCLGFNPEDDDGTGDAVVWYENNGAPQTMLWPKHPIADLHQAFDVAPADLDSDGDLDVVATGWSRPGRLVWCENAGDALSDWTMHIIMEPWRNANQVIAADFNGDGLPDIAASADQGSNQLYWWINKGRH